MVGALGGQRGGLTWVGGWVGDLDGSVGCLGGRVQKDSGGLGWFGMAREDSWARETDSGPVTWVVT